METPVHSPEASPLGPLLLGPGYCAQLLSVTWAQWMFFWVRVGGQGRRGGEARPSPQGPGGRGGALTNLSSYSGPSLRLVLGAGQQGPKFYTPAGQGLSYQCWSQRATLWGAGQGRHQGRDIQRRGHRVGRQRQTERGRSGERIRERQTDQRDKNQRQRQSEEQRQRRKDGSMEREDKREKQRVRAAPGRGGVPTKVAVGRDGDEAGVLLLLTPRLVGPVVQMCQVR